MVRQLPKSAGSGSTGSAPTSTSNRRRRDSSHARRTSNERDRKEEEERKQEIAKILSLTDPKEQAERFLRLLSGALADTTAPAKVVVDLTFVCLSVCVCFRPGLIVEL